ncbi:RhoGAP domain containing protein [Trichomonas vaginalis G3]|uniref:RhoGAP domain containing protein n=1 Tax=Trichomonas vaginalis (strain ATCC PRA-98 / G3) TaxID=412133 RepID=A2E2W6_TRIV3|nr:GTPase activator, FI04035P family [Trichomonas vaginalis G3]EAY13021.1 RhoGAP domain containing protein [Trichomonas vaginalis G3]KAI5503080.1 GTPase activator, FI04035P family [Trichomonas vaginalis G3]|eukprot:XP_001325244.1 RhoGAP domain containing protein [Trichomonas vaginalis G3]
MRRNRQLRLYCYHDKNSDKDYFHNPITNEILWVPPADCVIINPETLQPMKLERHNLNREKSFENNEALQMLKNVKARNRQSLVHDKVRYRRTAASRSDRKSTIISSLKTIPRSMNQTDTSTEDVPFYMPKEIMRDRLSIDVRQFATMNFNQRTKGSLFSKKLIPPDNLLQYSTDSSVLPILKRTPEKLTKRCVDIFNLVFDYCKQKPQALPSTLVKMLINENNFIDETYIILIKLITNNPSNDDIKRVWDLILVVCTFFPPSIGFRPFVRHIVAAEALGTNNQTNAIAKMAYIRLAARCDCGEIFPEQPEQWTNLIPTHPITDFFIFGAPLLELIYAQRRTAPKCTVPIFMVDFIKELFEAGCNTMEGMFRLPGNQSQIKLMVDEIQAGQNVIKGAELADLASLFKKWLADLPEPVVPMSMYQDLTEAIRNQTILEFVETLPKVNHDTLGYLIGYLKEFIKHADVTKMSIIPVSMIFGANIVRIVSTDQYVLKEMTDNGKKFIQYLISNWDTSFIYPLPEDYIPH